MTKKLLFIIIIAFFFFCSYDYITGQNKKDLTSEELKELIDSKSTDFLLIDVRTEAEYNSGYIPTAINIPNTEIKNNLNRIPKEKLIIVYCRSGRRSGIAEKELLDSGYTNIINFGGISKWKYELVK